MHYNPFDFSQTQTYFVNQPTQVTQTSGLVGGPVSKFSDALGNNSTSLLLAGMVIGLVAYAYWVRSLDR